MPAPKLIATAVLMAANVAMTALQTTEGPRLTDTRATVADYGTPSNNFVGTRMLPAHCIFAKPIVEKRQKRKGKGGKQVTYTGYGTFMVQVAEHPGDAVLQIYMDNHLVYDATGSSEKLYPLADDYDLESSLRIMLGAVDQEPDPDMLAYIEARDGPGTCPAYRDQFCIYFENIPLQNFGNRLPDVKVLAVRDAEPAYPLETVASVRTAPFRLWGVGYSQDASRFGWCTNDEYEIYDLATRTLIISGVPPVPVSTQTGMAFRQDGSFLMAGEGAVRQISADGLTSIDIYTTAPGLGDNLSDVFICSDGNGVEHWGAVPFSVTNHPVFDGVEFSPLAICGVDFRPSCYFTDAYGDVWCCGAVINGAGPGVSTAYFLRLVDTGTRGGSSFITVSGLPNKTDPFLDFCACHFRDGTHDQFVFGWTSTLYAADIDTGAITATGATYDLYAISKQLRWLPAGKPTLWTNSSSGVAYEVDLSDLSEISSFDLAGADPWGAIGSSAILYEPKNNALISAPESGDQHTLQWLFLDRVQPINPTLASLLALVAGRARLEPDDYDVSLVSGAAYEFVGYSWTQGTGAQIAEPVCDLFDVDLRPHDFQLQALPRGGASQGSIAGGELVLGDSDNADASGYRLVPVPDEDLPRRVFLTYADVESGQETNTAMPVGTPDRGASGSQGEAIIDMSPLALTPVLAQQLIERRQRRERFGRLKAEFSLTRQRIAIEPGDVLTPDLGGDAQTMRCTKLTIGADGVVATEMERDDPRLAALPGSQGAPAAGYIPPTVVTGVGTLGEVMDMALVTDAHEQTAPFLYLGAGPVSSGTWLGVDVAVSDTGDPDSFSEGWDGIASGDGAIIGACVEALPAAEPWVPDLGTTVQVWVSAGELTAATLEDLLLDETRNLAAIRSGGGWELVQFMTPTLVAPKTYAISGFLRGLRGTEWAIGGHAAGDRFILIDGMIKRHVLGAGEIGDTDYYAFTTVGDALAEETAVALPFTAAAHRPYAPVHAEVQLSGSDWTFSATRRTRIGGGTVDGQDVPLGQASESWSLDILDGATVVRTIEGVSLPLVYVAADQTTDFGAPLGAAPNAILYQVDPTLNLRGYPLDMTA